MTKIESECPSRSNRKTKEQLRESNFTENYFQQQKNQRTIKGKQLQRKLSP